MEKQPDIVALEKLLSASTVLDDMQRQIEQVNVLEIFGITRYELAHCAFWRWLCNPKGSHRGGTRFLKTLLRKLVERSGGEDLTLLDLESGNFNKAKIYVEKNPFWMIGRGEGEERKRNEKISQRRFDLAIWVNGIKGDPKKNVWVVLEFKIDAGQQESQTDDYAVALREWKLEDEERNYTLAAYVALPKSRPTGVNEAFSYLSLDELIATMKKESLSDAGRKTLPSSSLAVIDQYFDAVHTGVLGKIDGGNHGDFIEEHRKALGIIKAYLKSSPTLEDMEVAGVIQDGMVIAFRALAKSMLQYGRLKKVEGLFKVCETDSNEVIGSGSLSDAARTLQPTRPSFNGWNHWFKVNGVDDEQLQDSLCELRERAKLDSKELKHRLCAAILKDRESVIRTLMVDVEPAELEANEVPEGQFDPHTKSTKRVTLWDLCQVSEIGDGDRLIAKRAGKVAMGLIIVDREAQKAFIEVTEGVHPGRYETPSKAAVKGLGVMADQGWRTWEKIDPESFGETQTLDELRSNLMS